MRVLKYLLLFVFTLGLLFLLVFQPVDRDSYQDQDFYAQMLGDIDSVKTDTSSSNTFLVGWSRAAILPQTNLPIASYGLRPNIEGLHDTVYASVFAFDNGIKQTYLVTLDLLIFPPSITQYLSDSLGEDKASQIFLSATHTHNGPGGWMEGPAARFIAGAFDPDYVKLVGDSIISSLYKAQTMLQPGSMKFGKTYSGSHINNRISRSDRVDTLVQYIIFEKENKHRAILTTYSAHATCISQKLNLISRDYPGELCDVLENNGFDMAAFMAGAVGSMGNNCHGLKNFECVSEIGQSLAQSIQKSILEKNDETIEYFTFNAGRVILKAKALSPRVLENWSIRPWFFTLLTSKQESFISYLQLGDILLVGTPCDFSGVLSEEVYQRSAFERMIITSFNGTYVGYITPDQYFDLDESETHEMNWLGYGAGSYLSELMIRLSKQLKP
jgi:neutral ceramidase